MSHHFSKEFENTVIKDWVDNQKPSTEAQKLFSKYLTDRTKSIFEVGTGAGVISFYLEEVFCFDNINAIDIIPFMIKSAKKKAAIKKSKIKFHIADASDLIYFKNNQFFYNLYMGQILSMVPQNNLDNALLEAYRVGKPGGLFIFSFMDWDSRWYNPFLSFGLNVIRFTRGQKTEKYYLPTLRFRAGINWKFCNKGQQGILWVKKKSMLKRLQTNGFEIKTCYKEAELTKNHKGLSLYFICKKNE